MTKPTQEELQTLWEKVKTRNNPFSDKNYIIYEEVSADYGVTRLDIHPDSLNPHGMVHGGCLFTLADNACGLAVHSDGRRYVTQNGNLHFISNQNQGTLSAIANVRHRGKATCVVHVDIVGIENRLIATGEFSFYCINQNSEKK